MIEKKREPLILVVDDDDEFREEIISPDLKELGARVIMARDVQEAVLMAANCDPEKGDSIDLLILDMHMPLSEEDIEIDKSAGIKTFNLIKEISLHSPHCRSIVFTAHPSFKNCVESVKSGIYAYIPKRKLTLSEEIGTEGGYNELISTCKHILEFLPSEKESMPPSIKWLEKNINWILDRYMNKWVVYIPKEVAIEAGFSDSAEYTYRDGIVIINRDSRLELIKFISGNLKTLKYISSVAFISK
jgi:CheY-like chemotaxis protein